MLTKLKLIKMKRKRKKAKCAWGGGMVLPIYITKIIIINNCCKLISHFVNWYSTILKFCGTTTAHSGLAQTKGQKKSRSSWENTKNKFWQGSCFIWTNLQSKLEAKQVCCENVHWISVFPSSYKVSQLQWAAAKHCRKIQLL